MMPSQFARVVTAAVAVASSGAVTATVHVVPAVRSVTVSVDGSRVVGCFATATGAAVVAALIPGACVAPVGSVTVVGSRIAEHVLVAGTDASAARPPSWQLCFGTRNRNCRGTGGTPGRNQFAAATVASNSSSAITTAPSCDTSIHSGASDPCLLRAGERAREGLRFAVGATTEAAVHVTTVNWLAAP